MTAPASQEILPLIGAAAAEMTARLEETTAAVSEAIHRGCPELSDELRPATVQSTRANLSVITTMVRTGADPATLSPPQEALAYARTYVHEGLGMDLLTRVYRRAEHAYRRLWAAQLATMVGDPEQLGDALTYFEDWLFDYVGAVDGTLAAVHAEEYARRSHGGVAVQVETVRAILAGTLTDEATASFRLRHRLDGFHLGFVVWPQGRGTASPAPEGIAYAELHRVGRAVAAATGATGLLGLPMDGIYAGWVRAASLPDAAGLRARTGGFHVALGLPHRGLDGFRRTHEEALHAKRVLGLMGGDPSRMSFADLALEALLTRDVDEARRFVEREVGPLVDGSVSTQRLLDTLDVFLQEESSFARAARRLGVHENTVVYRIRRAEGVLGRRTEERPLELQAALRLARYLPRTG